MGIEDKRPAGETVRVADAGATPDGSVLRPGEDTNTALPQVEIEEAALDPATRVALSRDGQLTLLLKGDREFIIPGADPLIAAFRVKPWVLLQQLNDDRDALIAVLREANDPGTRSGTFENLIDELGGLDPAAGENDENERRIGDGRAVNAGGGSEQDSALNPLGGSNTSELGGLNNETGRFGRDDIKRGEFGSTGEQLTVGVGEAIGHLTGLSDEEPGLRNGEKIVYEENQRFQGEATGVGVGIDHLWLLGDTEYYRASTDDRDVDGLLPDRGNTPPVYGPLSTGAKAFALREDEAFTGQLFSPAVTILPVTNILTTMNPTAGSVVLSPNGTFVYTPANGFSGKTEFTYSFTDPRTGQPVSGTVSLTVEAVADPALISGSAITPEDTPVAAPVNVQLQDPDGSETIAYAEITNVPPGATLGFSTAPSATVTNLPGGGLRLTGDTADIQAALQNLTFSQATHVSGKFTLAVEVQTIESNANPLVPGFNDTETVNHDLVIEVTPVADQPPVTGGSFTTNEDTRVELTTLAGNLVDTDGSEVLSFTVAGVDPGARLEDTAGNELSFQLQPGGTKSYTITPAQIGDVFYEPAPNAHGTDNMTITATATEQANNDAASSNAPVTVVINPVTDLPTITGSSTVDEDTAVNFGANINIGPVIDADGSERITQVTIAGVPTGVTPTGTNVGGATFSFNPTNGTITVSGGSGQDIRNTVASLGLTPQNDTDNNIDLQVRLTTIDAGVVATTPLVTHTIAVAAVADTPTVSGTATGDEDQPINLPISANLNDTDGSESYEFAEVTVPAGITLSVTSLPPGITQTAITGGFRFEPGPTISAGDFETFLANNLRVQIPTDSDVDFNASVKVGVIESTLSGGEVTTLRAEQTATIPVTVNPVPDLPTITGSSSMNEDSITNTADQTQKSPLNFGANISITENDKTDGSEAISRIVVSGIPEGATVTYAPVLGGAPVTVVGAAGGSSITLSVGTEDQIRDALESMTIVPPLHSDADITLGLAVTKNDSGVTATQNGMHTVHVAAVADAPTVSGTASGLEDQPIGLNITADLVDKDGSETYDFAEVTVPTGVTLSVTSLPTGITQSNITGGLRFDIDPTRISAAAVENFLLNNLRVQAPKDSNVNFDVDVKVGTIESTLSGGQVALALNEAATTVNVEVTPVVDTPAINSSSTVKEDGIDDVSQPAGTGNTDVGAFGTAIEAGITLGETALGDTSEEVTQVVITGIPNDATIGTGTVAGATIDTGTPGQITVTGTSETVIRDALKTLTIVPGTHKDGDIPLGVAVTVRDSDPDDAGDTTSQTFNGTHTIQVAAVADEPTASGSAVGFEDQDLPVSINVGLTDTDGSETIKNVVIEGVPNGFTLTESSALAGVLTNNGSGRYTVTGASDAETKDVLDNLTLAIAAAPGPRTHLDTDFNLSVTVTAHESNPSETGAGQIAHLEESETFTVPITVHAVADAVTHSGSSVLVEDVNGNVGGDITFNKIDTDGTESVTQVTVTGFPTGSTVTFEPVGGGARQPFTGTTLTLNGGPETQIRAALASLEIQPPLHSDGDFNLTVTATTTDNTTSPNTADHTETTTWTHAVKVQAVADTPSIATNNETSDEDTLIPLTINANRSADGNTDSSEVLSVRITLPQDGGNPIGTIVATGTVTNGVTITDEGNGVHLIEGPGTDTPAAEEALIDAFLSGGLAVNPRAEFSGTFTGANGIKVEAVSTEQATGVGDQVAPNGFGGADNTSQTETVESTINITINPIVDFVTFANTQTIVQENNNESNPADNDLVVPLGTRLGTQLDDLDGSQSLSMTLANIPADVTSVAFGGTSLAPGGNATISSVTVSRNGAGTEISINGADASEVITVLQTLNITLNDDDENITVAISSTTVDTVGGPAAPFTANHEVVVQAVADTPDVDVGAATKATVVEDSGYVSYPVTVGLQDTDGSETYQSAVVEFSTVSSGNPPEIRFTTTTGVSVDTTVAGRVTLTGGTTAQMEAALASLQVRPGVSNGEDITIRVTPTAVESNPTETNDKGPGVAGDEISVPTASNQATFVIPVNPVPEIPTLTAPAMANGTEDQSFGLAGISISTATTDTDGSESNFFEIQTSSIPAGTTFRVGTTVQTNVVDGFLRIAEADLPNLQMQAPLHYSGTINLTVRAAVVDDSATNDVTTTTATQTIAVDVVPVADPITGPNRSTGVEDNGPVAFGNRIANNLTMTDTVVGGPGEGGDETVSQLVLRVPADTATQTYSMSGANVPGTDGTINGFGSARVELSTDGSGNRTYTITSIIITGAADLGTLTDAQRDQADADIKNTLRTFNVEMGPTHSDLEGSIAVTATALDVKNGHSSTQDSSSNHQIRIQAVADTPTISASAIDATVAEDGGATRLAINPGRSPDEDGTETLSVRITVPSDTLGPVGTITGSPTGTVTLTHQGNGVYLVEATGADVATREAALDAFLNGGGLSFDPRNDFAGSVDLTIASISTEAATGNQLANGTLGGADGTSKTETVETTVTVDVTPTVDAPSVKGNAIGNEDERIAVPLNITLGDTDGSETFTVRITTVAPPTTKIFGAGGTELTPDGSGFYNLSAADVSALSILPPEHFSTANHPDIVLTVETTVTDTAGAASVSQVFTNNIPVKVQGVADKPDNPTVNVSADEDEPINIGAPILAAAGGSLNDLTPDNDGSETVNIILSGVPASVVPSSTTGDVTFIGNGTWQISEAALPNLVLPPVPNFSGTNPYSTLKVSAVSQEQDGDQASSDDWTINIEVDPVINSSTVDGFSSWSAAATVTEDNDIPLSIISNHALVDNDGSEQVVSYTLDLSNLIADAGIGQRLVDLHGAGAGLNEFIQNHVNGTIDSIDLASGTITVLAANAAGLSFGASAFRDSNVDFNVPVSALVRDAATLSSGTLTADKTETTTFNVNFVGDADIPTAFANDATGLASTLIKLDVGGENTDTDSDLGRAESEDQLYYILEVQNMATAPRFFLMDSSNSITGANFGGGKFLVTPGQLADLHVKTDPGPGGDIEFTWTTYTIENDGDIAENQAPGTFTATVLPSGGTVTPPEPLPPQVVVNPVGDNEDGTVVLDAVVNADPLDTTNPTVTVVIGNLPAGTTVTGAFLDPSTNEWVASAADVNAGNVSFDPPTNFSGDLEFTIRAVATTKFLRTASTGDDPFSVPIDPVADGVNITASPAAATEDGPFDLNISLSPVDGTDQAPSSPSDTPEVVDDTVYVRASSGALSAGILVTTGPFAGFNQMTRAELSSLQLTPATNQHGSVTIDVRASSTEPDDDADGDNTLVSSHSFTVDVTADADAPTNTVGGPYVGDEDVAITLTGLNADLVDTDGSEILSVKISGVPEGSLFSAGTNNGDNSWTIPKSALDAGTLTITPPLHFSGTMNLVLESFALETSNGDTATTATPFTVTIDPKADDVEILGKDVSIDADGDADLELNVRMIDERGTEPGENAPETMEITFSNVPTGVRLIGGSGGSVVDLGGNQWFFTGTEDEANDLEMLPTAKCAGTTVVSVSAVTIDGADRLGTPVTDTFQLTVPAIVAGDGSANTLNGSGGTQLLFGEGNADTLNSAGGDDVLYGGTGADVLTGGSGADTFAWAATDLDGSTDQVTDFIAADGDKLDVSQLLIGFDPMTSDLDDFLRLSGSGPATLQVDVNGAAGGANFQDVTTFDNAGQSLDDLRTNGNLIV